MNPPTSARPTKPRGASWPIGLKLRAEFRGGDVPPRVDHRSSGLVVEVWLGSLMLLLLKGVDRSGVLAQSAEQNGHALVAA